MSLTSIMTDKGNETCSVALVEWMAAKGIGCVDSLRKIKERIVLKPVRSQAMQNWREKSTYSVRYQLHDEWRARKTTFRTWGCQDNKKKSKSERQTQRRQFFQLKNSTSAVNRRLAAMAVWKDPLSTIDCQHMWRNTECSSRYSLCGSAEDITIFGTFWWFLNQLSLSHEASGRARRRRESSRSSRRHRPIHIHVRSTRPSHEWSRVGRSWQARTQPNRTNSFMHRLTWTWASFLSFQNLLQYFIKSITYTITSVSQNCGFDNTRMDMLLCNHC